MSEKLRIASVRVYYLDRRRRIEETDKFIYFSGPNIRHKPVYKDRKELKKWAEGKMKVDKSRNYKLEVRTNKGRFLFDKR